MAKSKKQRAKAAAKRKVDSFKGKYPGPDVFKGNKKLIARWKAAGSPPVTSKKFAKEFPAKARSIAGNKSKPAAAAPKPSATAPRPSATVPGTKSRTPSGAPNVNGVVADPNGNLVSADNWRADQARLASLAEDQEELQSIYAQEDAANNEELNSNMTAKQQRDYALLTTKKQRDEFKRSIAHGQKKLNTNTSYRGMGRSSAYSRGQANLNKSVSNISTDFDNKELDIGNTYKTNVRNAALRKSNIHSSLSPRKLYLANRAANKGVYTR